MKLQKDFQQYAQESDLENDLNNRLKLTFDEIKKNNPNLSLDEVLYAVYDKVKDNYNKPFDVLRNMILKANNIDELEYYTKNVRKDLKYYIEENIFPQYSKNDGGHNIAHILEVIRRSFALNDTFKLGLDDNMIYAIASCHDWGKYENHATHHLIAAKNFMNNEGMKNFFTDEQRKIIKEAIEDHRSSREDEARSVYGKLISSVDRNNTVEDCLRRTYTYGKKLKPDATDEELFLRSYDVLNKKFGENGYVKFYFKDKKYEEFLREIRSLLKEKDTYIITQRDYIMQLKIKKII